jgi:ornithine cyclodeaminase/alanine dehydrogenase-like protein (mu-crystallin family)
MSCAAADIVATCTDSIRVVVNDWSWIEAGMHLTCVKANEWSPEIVKKPTWSSRWDARP